MWRELMTIMSGHFISHSFTTRRSHLIFGERPSVDMMSLFLNFIADARVLPFLFLQSHIFLQEFNTTQFDFPKLR